MAEICRKAVIRSLALALPALALAGCAGQDAGIDLAPAATPPAIAAEQLVGRWGIGSFHRDDDRERTVREARNQCRQPYEIRPGSGGGAVMHLADDPEPHELQTKGAPGGRTFVGPPGEAGDRRDREIIAFEDGVMIMTWVDPEVASRYGTLVFVRCDGPPSPARAARQT